MTMSICEREGERGGEGQREREGGWERERGRGGEGGRGEGRERGGEGGRGEGRERGGRKEGKGVYLWQSAYHEKCTTHLRTQLHTRHQSDSQFAQLYTCIYYI